MIPLAFQNHPRHSRVHRSGGLPRPNGSGLSTGAPLGNGRRKRLPSPARPQQQRQLRHLLLHGKRIQVRVGMAANTIQYVVTMLAIR